MKLQLLKTLALTTLLYGHVTMFRVNWLTKPIPSIHDPGQVCWIIDNAVKVHEKEDYWRTGVDDWYAEITYISGWHKCGKDGYDTYENYHNFSLHDDNLYQDIDVMQHPYKEQEPGQPLMLRDPLP